MGCTPSKEEPITCALWIDVLECLSCTPDTEICFKCPDGKEYSVNNCMFLQLRTRAINEVFEPANGNQPDIKSVRMQLGGGHLDFGVSSNKPAVVIPGEYVNTVVLAHAKYVPY